MAATPDFSWSYQLTPNDELEGELFNSSMTELESYVNALKARLDILDGAVVPAEYLTETDLTNHVDATTPHKRMVKFGASDVLAGSSIPAGKAIIAQKFSGTVDGGGTVGVSFSVPYTGGGLIGVFVTPTGTATPLAVSAPAVSGVTVVGTAGTAFHGIAWGWY